MSPQVEEHESLHQFFLAKFPSFPQLSLSPYDLISNKFEGMREFLAKTFTGATRCIAA